jgi:hypothetical protein
MHSKTKVWTRVKRTGYPTWHPTKPLTYTWDRYTLTAQYKNAWNHKGGYTSKVCYYLLNGPGFENIIVLNLGEAKRKVNQLSS